MPTEQSGAVLVPPRPAPAPTVSPGAGLGIVLMVGSALANQVGAAVGALAFPVIGAVGVVAVRQWVAGALLVALDRPRPWRFTAAQWRPVLLLAVVFAAMNLALDTETEHLGIFYQAQRPTLDDRMEAVLTKSNPEGRAADFDKLLGQYR